ncbi:meiotic fizzy-related protein 1-like [Nylanderia fulva]|uniref:meiotic fizzy-related protein 1-like n=1 Tax=Nylanderia fulva TaxID=613905 RepID=UPI0010FAEBF9|nr:meiotic fizzy-related protein 1-like [Nylanderia fulva]XP_029169509.1 meiotic fizzy-related protein 1-like [Nylanderia fulva]
MSRVLDFEEQNHDAPSDTPLRGYQPRFRRTELNNAKPDSQRKWYLAPIFHAALTENSEERKTQNFSNSLNDGKIRACNFKPRQIYSGDRFIPCRRGYNFEAAHYLLSRNFNKMEQSTLEVHKQLDWLPVRHERKAFHAIMLKQGVTPGLNQNRILHYSNSTIQQSQKPQYAGWIQGAGYKEEGIWKCKPRKKTMIKDAKLLSIPDSVAPEGNNVANLVDWSCNNIISIGNRSSVAVYDDSGSVLTSWREEIRPREVKWSNDGSKLAVCTNSKIIMYNLETKKSMWVISCKCILTKHFNTTNECRIRCICWSLGDSHIVTGCGGSISIHTSDSGKLVTTTVKHTDRISNLKFSPNFKYLVSAAQDKTVEVFIWPELTPFFQIEFNTTNAQAIAWHPQVSGTLCIGDCQNELSLWDINKTAMVANVHVKDEGFRLHNFAWNKLSGELVVHWKWQNQDTSSTIAAVLASFDRIVDELPLFEEQLYFLKFNATHEQLIGYGKDGDDHVFWIWHFFGDEKFEYGRNVPLYNSARRRQGILYHSIR